MSLRMTTSHGSSCGGASPAGRTAAAPSRRSRTGERARQVPRARRRALDVQHLRRADATQRLARRACCWPPADRRHRHRAPRARARPARRTSRRARRRSCPSAIAAGCRAEHRCRPTAARPAREPPRWLPTPTVAVERRARRRGASGSSIASTHVSPRTRGAIGSTNDRNAVGRQPRRPRRRTSPAVGWPSREQHDPRHVAGRQLGARRVERRFEVGAACDRSAPAVDAVGSGCASSAQRRGVVDARRRSRRTRRCASARARSAPLSASIRARRVLDRAARDAVRHVDEVDDRQPRRARRDDRTRQRQRQRREQQRSRARPAATAAAD